MARESQQNISVAPQGTNPQRTTQFTEVVAKPVDLGQAVGSVDTELAGLAAGLSAFNPHLQQFMAAKDQKDGQEAALTGEAAARTAQIDPANVSQLPESMPAVIDPAFRPNFDQAYKSVLGQRLGIQSSAAIAAEYDKQKMNPDFNADTFLAQQLKEKTAGIQDPTIANEIAKSNIQLSQKIRESDNAVKHGALKDATLSNVTTVMKGIIEQSAGDPSKLSSTMNQFLDDGKAAWNNYYTRPEMAQQLVKEVTAASLSEKGNPSLFDALDKIPDPVTKKTIAEMNPDLALAIAQGRKVAEAQFDKVVEKESQKTNLATLARWDENLKKTGEAVSLAEVMANTGNGPGSIFQTDKEAMAFMKSQEAHKKQNADLTYALQAFKDGTAWKLDPELQGKAIQFATKDTVDALAGMMNDPSRLPEIRQQAMLLAKIHADGNATIPNESLVRMFNGLTAIPMDASGNPSPRFMAAVEIYKAMPENVRGMYFKDDAEGLMNSYTKSVDSQIDPSTAYKSAYQGISPEAKERAKELTGNHEWQAKTAKVITDAVDGMHFTWRDATPFVNDMPGNTDVATNGGKLEAKRFLMANPNLGEKDVEAHMKKWVTDNYVHDTNSNMLIGVPPGQGQAAQEVIKFHQEKLIKEHGEDARPILTYMGNGNYMIQTLSPIATVGYAKYADLVKEQVGATSRTPEDLAAITELRQKVASGKFTAEDYAKHAPMISKMRALGLTSDLPLRELDNAQEARTQAALKAMPKFGISGASSVIAPNSSPTNDRNAQKSITQQFLNQARDGVSPNTSFNSLAGALITQGESVALKVYDDPAKGAGKNIGIGYNLNGNAGTLESDFRKAGIPVESIEAIKAGKASITAEQAQRLLNVTVERYADKAKGVIEKKYPGMWNRMTPNQKAVVTDVAYQVKDFSQFGPSIDALFSGDQARIDGAFQVKFTDQNGTVKVDTRRNNLRANMLKGTSVFSSIVLNN
jgi:hypothetical protein